jgi:hypothetical protein
VPVEFVTVMLPDEHILNDIPEVVSQFGTELGKSSAYVSSTL